MRLERSIPTLAVKAVLTDESGRILFLQRNKKTRDDDQWDLPRGLIDDVENAPQALNREAIEELGGPIVVGEEIGR